MEIRIVKLTPAQFRRHIDESLGVYISAMQYPQNILAQRKGVWFDHSHWHDFTAVAAVVDRSVYASSLQGPEHRRFRWRRKKDSTAAVPFTAAANGVEILPTTQEASTSDKVVGICYGYRMRPGQWWYDRVSAGVRAANAQMPQVSAELTELHVLPQLQGSGLGRQLLERFLATRPEPTVMLSTPEVAGSDNLAWHLYRRSGFTDVLRNFYFEGDPRPFAILQRTAPAMTP